MGSQIDLLNQIPGDIETPPAGEVALWSDGVGVFQRDSAGVDTLIGPTPGTTNIYGTELVKASNAGPVVYNGPANIYQDALQINPLLISGRTYTLEWSFNWGYNAANTDFLARVLQNGVSTPWTMRQEPKDTGGGGPGGTDQRHPVSFFLDDITGVGGFDFRLQLSSSAAGVDAVMENIRFKFYRNE